MVITAASPPTKAPAKARSKAPAPPADAKPRPSKAERRKRQRATNLLRAEKMHKVRLEMAPHVALDAMAELPKLMRWTMP
jgi:hypothetical protein